MSWKNKIKIIIGVLKGEEFVPRSEGSAVNDDTKVFVSFIGGIEAEKSAGDCFNPKTGRIEIRYVLTDKKEEKN